MTPAIPPELTPIFEPHHLTEAAIAEALAHAEWAAPLALHHRLGLALYFRPFRVAPGSELCAEDEPGSYMGVLLSGLLWVGKRDFYGTARHISVVEPGDTFGEMSFLDDAPRSASLSVAEDASLLILTRSRYQELTKSEPELAVALLEQMCRTMSARVRALSERAVQRLI